jgi:hypothetical protein
VQQLPQIAAQAQQQRMQLQQQSQMQLYQALYGNLGAASNFGGGANQQLWAGGAFGSPQALNGPSLVPNAPLFPNQ